MNLAPKFFHKACIHFFLTNNTKHSLINYASVETYANKNPNQKLNIYFFPINVHIIIYIKRNCRPYYFQYKMSLLKSS